MKNIRNPGAEAIMRIAHKDSDRKKQRSVLDRIATIIRTERKLRKLTQIDLARKLRVTQGYLSKLEQAQLQPRVTTWLEFCRDFGVNPYAPMSHSDFRVWKRDRA